MIAGYSGGAPETIIPGVTGLLASDVGEVVDALAYLSDRRSAAAMGAAGRAFVAETYAWGDVMERFDRALGG